MQIENYKAIKYAELSSIEDVVIIAGPNGIGKSTIFDAIRLIKSVYGGYQVNEWQQWFNEFQMPSDLNPEQMLLLLKDKSKPLKIQITIAITEDIQTYIRENKMDLISSLLREQMFPNNRNYMLSRGLPIAASIDEFTEALGARAKKEAKTIDQELSMGEISGEIKINTKGYVNVKKSALLELLFSLYDPQNIGIIDYHGPQRSYQRELVGGINLNIQTAEERASQHALYNYASKYTNIKEEMASQLVTELLRREAGLATSGATSLVDSLKELFEKFFPGKHFSGPQPTLDGKISFPVQTDDGTTHDINELSSGEKEVLYGYLRLKNLSPRNSVLLIDEPELHLNPRLVQGLPQFYQKHLGASLGNQIWLLTHSDGLLREAIQTEGAKVFHMTLPDKENNGRSQVQEIKAQDDLEAAIINLVGDLATYQPGKPLVIFEGDTPAEFDIFMVSRLFPDFARKVNLISGKNKSGVRQLHATLESAHKAGVLPFRVYSIVDKDFETEEPEHIATGLHWDAYHIENYLIHPPTILKVGNDLMGGKFALKTIAEVENALHQSAEEILQDLVVANLQKTVSDDLFSVLQTRINPKTKNLPEEIVRAIEVTSGGFKEVVSKLTVEKIKTIQDSLTKELNRDLSGKEWIKSFPGRKILAKFADRYLKVNTSQFFNLLVSAMRDEKHEPEGMKTTLNMVILR